MTKQQNEALEVIRKSSLKQGALIKKIGATEQAGMKNRMNEYVEQLKSEHKKQVLEFEKL